MPIEQLLKSIQIPLKIQQDKVNLPPPAEAGASYSTYLLGYMFKALARSSCGGYIIIYNKYT